MPASTAAARWRVSPQELEPELQLPRVVGRGDRAEGAGAAVAVRRAEVRVVEQVERLQAELDVRGAARGEPLRERGVELPEDGPAHGVPRGVAERLARIGRRRHARLV